MEVYAYEGGHISLQGSNHRREVNFRELFKSSSSKAEVSFYSPKLKELFSKADQGTLFSLKKADAHIAKLETILAKLHTNNTSSPSLGEEMLQINNGLGKLLKKFPMLSAITTQIANWDIKTLIGRDPIANQSLKEMKEAIRSVQDRLRQVAVEEISKIQEGSDFLQRKEEIPLLGNISSLSDGEMRNSYNKLSTNRVIDLI